MNNSEQPLLKERLMIPIKRYLSALFIGICFLVAGPIYSMDTPVTGFTDGFELTTQITLEPTISEVALVGDSGGESDPHWINKSKSFDLIATVTPLGISVVPGEEDEDPNEIPQQGSYDRYWKSFEVGWRDLNIGT